ncbi:MAG: hypothetical protein JRD05_01980 [Deltaproteobacteria bacterium]|nr:hypothetical protein [Deltaproteobacteria bacterium]
MSTKPIQMKLPLSKSRTLNTRAGVFRTREAVREALKRALDRCHLSREEVSEELSRLVGEEISHSLNNWCAEGKQNRRLPLEFAKALVMVTGDSDILRAALLPEFDLVDEKGKAALDYGIMLIEDKTRLKLKRRLEQKAKGLVRGGVD